LYFLYLKLQESFHLINFRWLCKVIFAVLKRTFHFLKKPLKVARSLGITHGSAVSRALGASASLSRSTEDSASAGGGGTSERESKDRLLMDGARVGVFSDKLAVAVA